MENLDPQILPHRFAEYNDSLIFCNRIVAYLWDTKNSIKHTEINLDLLSDEEVVLIDFLEKNIYLMVTSKGKVKVFSNEGIAFGEIVLSHFGTLARAILSPQKNFLAVSYAKGTPLIPSESNQEEIVLIRIGLNNAQRIEQIDSLSLRGQGCILGTAIVDWAGRQVFLTSQTTLNEDKCVRVFILDKIEGFIEIDDAIQVCGAYSNDLAEIDGIVYRTCRFGLLSRISFAP